MAIFQSIPTCEIFGCSKPSIQLPNGQIKKRCGKCEHRFDSRGDIFIIYCNLWRFHKGQKTVLFWVSENIVEKVVGTCPVLLKVTTKDLKKIMEASGYQ